MGEEAEGQGQGQRQEQQAGVKAVVVVLEMCGEKCGGSVKQRLKMNRASDRNSRPVYRRSL